MRETVDARTDNARLADGEGVEDWTIVGTPGEVRDQLERYRETLGMTHLIATRLRIGGIPEPTLRESVGLLAEIVAEL